LARGPSSNIEHHDIASAHGFSYGYQFVGKRIGVAVG
jgi:hypothetical protein